MQYSFCFDTSSFGEAVENEYGVLIGCGLERFFLPAKSRASAKITVRRIGGNYCYGIDIAHEVGGQGFAPSLKWNLFESFESAIFSATEQLKEMVARDLSIKYCDVKKHGLVEIKKMIERNEFEDKTI